MRISSIGFNNYIKPNFTSTRRSTYQSPLYGTFLYPECRMNLHYCDGKYDPNTELVCSNYTNFLRSDLNWACAVRYFDEHFPKGKVNIHNFACSDGSEPYSLAIALIEKLGEERAQRFFPIKATDVDSDIIELAKKGYFYASSSDVKRLDALIGRKDGLLDYFDIEPIATEPHYDFILYPKEKLTECVEFSCEDFADGVKKIKKSENNIILARNFWKYLPTDTLANACFDLTCRLNHDSLVLIGNYDRDFNSLPFFIKDMGLDTACDMLHLEANKNILSMQKAPHRTLFTSRQDWFERVEDKRDVEAYWVY